MLDVVSLRFSEVANPLSVADVDDHDGVVPVAAAGGAAGSVVACGGTEVSEAVVAAVAMPVVETGALTASMT